MPRFLNRCIGFFLLPSLLVPSIHGEALSVRSASADIPVSFNEQAILPAILNMRWTWDHMKAEVIRTLVPADRLQPVGHSSTLAFDLDFVTPIIHDFPKISFDGVERYFIPAPKIIISKVEPPDYLYLPKKLDALADAQGLTTYSNGARPAHSDTALFIRMNASLNEANEAIRDERRSNVLAVFVAKNEKGHVVGMRILSRLYPSTIDTVMSDGLEDENQDAEVGIKLRQTALKWMRENHHYRYVEVLSNHPDHSGKWKALLHVASEWNAEVTNLPDAQNRETMIMLDFKAPSLKTPSVHPILLDYSA